MADRTKTETSGKSGLAQDAQLMAGPKNVLFAKTFDPNITIGVVTEAEPSSLTLLAAGVAGMAARRARRQRLKSSL